MNILITITLLLSLNLSVNSLFLNPNILAPKPITKTICQSSFIEATDPPSIPYLTCPTQSNLRILNAVHLPTTSTDQCPQQFILPITGTSTDCFNPVLNNVTSLLGSFCNLQNVCAFKFSQIVTDANAAQTEFGLTCLNADGNTFTHIPLAKTFFKVTYQCDAPRQRFRPFSNKRYDPKFSPSAFHHIRHPSNNRFVA